MCFLLLAGLVSALIAAPAAAIDLSAWQNRQELSVTTPGLVKINLRPDTLDAGRSGLEDLRVVDDGGNELPYSLERPRPADKVIRAARSYEVSLTATSTVLLVETGFAGPLDGVSLESPAPRFIKAVRIEGSSDQKTWQLVAEGRPIFRQANGASQLQLTWPAGVWPFLRMAVEDRRSEAIPFTGVRIHAAESDATPIEPVAIRMVSRDESPGQTRLTLDLGAAHLDLAALTLDATDALFTRSVTLAVREVSENSVRELPLARGVVYRVTVEGQPAAASLTVPLELQPPSRELVLLIQNDDSPPLQIVSVSGHRRPVYLTFSAGHAGRYSLLTGNSRAPAPRYDVASLAASLKSARLSPLTISPLGANPGFRPPEVLPDIPTGGSALEVTAWKFRKRTPITRAGVQQLELDVEILAHAQPDFRDVRLIRAGQQHPFIIEHTSLTRTLVPQVSPANDPKRPKVSRWSIRLPYRSLPITQLALATRTPLFNRTLMLFEEVADERGEKRPGILAQAAWVQTPDSTSRQFYLPLSRSPGSDLLFLETDNQDNPPIELENFQLFYPATRLLFKAATGDLLHLYYGNPAADFPRYDLSLVAAQLLAAEKSVVNAAAEERLKKSSWRNGHEPLSGGVVLWITLALVVVGLLAVIARLLPRTSTPPGAAK